MNIESPEMAKEFPGLYTVEGHVGGSAPYEEEDGRQLRRKELVWRKAAGPSRKDRGYRMFEEENSEEELVTEDTSRSPSKMKKHSKPSFKFAKRDKFYKPKEKDKEDKKDKEKKDKGDKDQKKKDEKLRWKKKKLLVATKEEQPTIVDPDYKPIFGVALLTAVAHSKSHDGILLPAIFRECIDYVEEFGLTCEGIYRISGVKSKVQALKDLYNAGAQPYLHEHEPNIVASLLKQYLRELPSPILTKELMPKFEEASTIKNVKQKVEQFQQLVASLPVPNRLLLSWMIVHMTHVIAQEKQNKMSLQNVSIVLSPTMQISHRVLNVLFTYSMILFRDTVIKRYVPPLRPVTSRWSLELPDSPSALEEELNKQESLLNQLHEDLMKMKDPDKEEQVWEVQRVVTQLKRKLKHARKAVEAATASASREQEIAMDKQHDHQQQEQHKVKILPKVQSSPQQHKQRTPDKHHAATKQDQAQAADADGHQVEPQSDVKTEVGAKEATEDQKGNENKDESEEVHLKTKQNEESAESAETDVAEAGADSGEPVSQPNDAEEQSPDKAAESSVLHPPEDSSKPEAEVGEASDSATICQDNEVVDQDNGMVPESGSQERIEESQNMSEAQQAEFSETCTAATDTVAEDDVDSQMMSEADTLESNKEEDSEAEESVEEEEEGGEEEEEEWEPLKWEGQTEEASQTTNDMPEQAAQEPSQINEEKEDEARDEDDSSWEKVEQQDAEDEEAEYESLQQQHTELQLEEEELLAIGDELRTKIETEESEIGRLHQEIVELQAIRQDLYDSDEMSSESSEESEDEEDLKELLQQMVKDNEELELKTKDLCMNIHEERQACLNVKVQIRMIQQRQLDSSSGVDFLLCM